MNDHTLAFLNYLGGPVFDFRAMHDTDKSREAITWRGTIAQHYDDMVRVNGQGYGIHVMINETNGLGRRIEHVTTVRAQLVDLDSARSVQNLQRLNNWSCPPHMIVNTSPGKVHGWLMVTPHTDKQLYVDNQRRLIQFFEGDPQFIDVAHTARLPGFWHLKAEPYFVALQAGPAWSGRRYDPWEIAAPLLHIPLISQDGSRHPLGTASMSAPSMDWLAYALWRIDPNSLGFLEWIAVTAAVKQAGWQFGERAVYDLWSAWCGYFRNNDPGENNKQWNHINETQSGWKAIVQRSGIQAELMLAQSVAEPARQQSVVPSFETSMGQTVQPPMPEPSFGSYLTPSEQVDYFKGCYSVLALGKIFTPDGRLMDSTKFNLAYGGKTFQLSNLDNAKVTDEPYKAATRGTAYQLPKVDHLRFVPQAATGAVLLDELGRKGLNTYKRILTVYKAGDVTLFLQHMERLIPDARDRAIVYSYMAFQIQHPGVKVAWAPVIQSMEGAGKSMFKSIMGFGLGQMYIHTPNAQQLSEGGGKFNKWCSNKLMIIVDEVRTDEKRELIEILKPLIADARIEIQGKGADQEMFDSPANWLMFTNYKDAIPITDMSRRFVIIYSQIQSLDDLNRLGMDGQYFNRLYRWVDHAGGASAVCEWLSRYAIPNEFNPLVDAARAPRSSSHAEALSQSHGPIEQFIAEAASSNIQGFRGGWVSTVALAGLLRENGQRVPGPNTIAKALHNLGYKRVGKSMKAYFQEGSKFQSNLWNLSEYADLSNYGKLQGYET